MRSPTLTLSYSQEATCLSGREGRYNIIERPLGFRVEGNDRVPVEVLLESTHWSIVSDGSDVYRHPPRHIGLYSYRVLLEQIASTLMWYWEPPEGRGYPTWPLRAWVFEQTRRALHKRIYAQWQHLLSTVPDPIRHVARAIFAATFDHYQLGCESWQELYSGPYHLLIADVTRYRGAAIACHNALTLASHVTWKLAQTRERLHPGSPPGTVEAHFGSLQDPTRCTRFGEKEGEEERHRESKARLAILDALALDWKAFFSSTGQAHRSLNRTLMSLPGGIPNTLVTQLPFLDVTRPVTNRVELITQLLFNEYIERLLWPPQDDISKYWATRIVAKASREEILRALTRFCVHEHLPQRPTSALLRQFSIFICSYCADGPPEHTGNVVGLVEKAIEWKLEQMARKVANLDRSAPTTLPPIPLPSNSGIQFLASAGAVIDEGTLMSHCIADYAEAAIKGEVYLFHINYRTGSASTMVDARAGRVGQSYGPGRKPTPNMASAYGKRVLSSWARELPIRGEVRDLPSPASEQGESDGTPF